MSVDQPNQGEFAAVKSSAKRCSVQFDLNDKGQLLAVLVLDDAASPVSLSSLKMQLQQHFSALWIDTDALITVVAKATTGVAESIVVGERRDACVTVNIANNKMAAHVSIEQAYGGRELDKETLLSVLQANHVSLKCVRDELIAEALQSRQANNALIAKAIEPVNGDDGRLDVLIEESIEKTLEEDQGGHVDFHQFQNFVVVDEGVELARIIPPTAGQPGENVLGGVIEPRPGRMVKFSGSLEGAMVSESDPNLLISTVKGHPVIMKDGVRVDPTLVLKEVNLASGNIDFDGSVFVKGSVASGFEIRATGDVVVKDTVDKARIIAGGNIEVGNGVLGEEPASGVPILKDDQADGAQDAESTMKTYLCAEGDVSAKFINLSEIKAGQCIRVKEYTMHCRLTAKDYVLLGQAGGKGGLFGGVTYAEKSVIANQIGTEAYIKTAVIVGRTKAMNDRLSALRQEAQQRQANIDKLLLAQEKIQRAAQTRELPSELQDKAKKIAETLPLLERQIEKLELAKLELLKPFEGHPQASVEVKNTIYPNATLLIDGIGYQQTTESKAICFKNTSDAIVLSSFTMSKH